MESDNQLANVDIHNKIITIRGLQVIIDKDLATLYGVETKVFNQAVKRNIQRFPESFRFQLSQTEAQTLQSDDTSLRSQNVTLKSQRGKHRKYLPYVFTEQGVSMLSAVLKSPTAITISIKIIDSFVKMRQFLSVNGNLFNKIEQIEKRQIGYELKSNDNFEKIFKAIEDKAIKPKQGIFYDGQIFDAYAFMASLIKQAENSIVLIDGYIDETVLTLLSKNKKIKVTILTKNISKQLKLDCDKYNQQYGNLKVKTFNASHDRFLIIDNKELYHIGASLKDLGKKWFAFTKMDMGVIEVLEQIAELGYEC